MLIVDAAFWAVCLVIVASGATKVSDPASFASALLDLGLTTGAPRRVATGVGLVEVALGVAGLALGGVGLAAAVALLYVAFTVIVVLARSRGLASCGCFGARSGRPTRVHAAINAASAIVASVAAVTSSPGVADGIDGRGAAGGVAVVAAVGLAALVVVVDTR